MRSISELCFHSYTTFLSWFCIEFTMISINIIMRWNEVPHIWFILQSILCLLWLFIWFRIGSIALPHKTKFKYLFQKKFTLIFIPYLDVFFFTLRLPAKKKSSSKPQLHFLVGFILVWRYWRWILFGVSLFDGQRCLLFHKF